MKKFLAFLILSLGVYVYCYHKYPMTTKSVTRCVMRVVHLDKPVGKVTAYYNNVLSKVRRRRDSIRHSYNEKKAKVKKWYNKGHSLYKKSVAVCGAIYEWCGLGNDSDSIPEPQEYIEPELPGTKYEIQYVISYKGSDIPVSARSLGRPHVSNYDGEACIKYKFPTGSRYRLTIPEGYIKLLSVEKVKKNE